MAARVLAAGYSLTVHDAHRAAASSLLADGARWAESLADVAAAEVVLLSLPGPREVEAVVAGPDGLLAHAAPGTTLVDLSTSSVATVRALAADSAERGVHFLDCPVSGGAPGARDGTLVLMVGGDAAALEVVRPVLDTLSRSIVHLGDSGAGTVAKLVNNQLYLCSAALFYEGLVLGSKAGLDPSALVEILKSTRAGGIHAELAERVLERQWGGPDGGNGTTFSLDLAEKDVALALEAGRSLAVGMPVSAAAHQLFVDARAAGLGARNFWNAFEIVEDRARVRVAPGSDGSSPAEER